VVDQLERVGRHTERFLLDQIFNVSTRLESADARYLSEAERHSFACFNSNDVGGRNLESYLNLIVRVSAPQPIDQYKFYSNAKDRVRNGEPLSKVMLLPEFSFERSEASHRQLWRTLINSLEEFDSATIGHMIRHAIESITDYSALDSADLSIGLRHSTLPFSILKMLDVGGWHDRDGRHRDNVDDNVKEIAEWIYGLGTHSGEGITDALVSPSRGIIGWHDVLIFRLYSCIDRNSSLFNLHRALTHFADPNAPLEGVPLSHIVITEMRMMSQRIFQHFKAQYIETGRNIFADIRQLDLDQLAGKFRLHVHAKINAGHVSDASVQSAVAACKTAMKAFIVYQLTNKLVSGGIGCGYYDGTGNADQGDIFQQMNAYLFGVCFATTQQNDGHRYFIEYLLAGFERFDGTDSETRRPSIDRVTVVLDPPALKAYWSAHREAIFQRKFDTLSEEVVTPNYTMSYAAGVPVVLTMLEHFLQT
jgi:hypothetical protein